MPSMLSSNMRSRKQLLSCGVGVPALYSVGEACVIILADSMRYVSIARSRSSSWMPSATRINMCCGRSTVTPSELCSM